LATFGAELDRRVRIAAPPPPPPSTTRSGVPAIEALTAALVNVDVTLLFSASAMSR
jgi:hypothetical protein